MRIRHLNKFLFFLLILLLAVICIAPAVADYTTFHGDMERSGAGDAVNIIHSDSEYVFTTGDFNPASDSVFADFTTQKVLVKLTDFFSLNNPTTNVYAQEPSKSKAVYCVENGEAVTGSPAVCNGYIYYGTSAGVVCYEITKKKQAWSYSACGAVCSGITVADNRLWFGTASGKLCSLTLAGADFKSTDSIDTTHTTGLSSTPLVVGDTVYVTTQTPATLKGYKSADLTETVNISLESRVAAFSSPSYANGIIYTSGMGGIATYSSGDSANSIQIADGNTGTPVYHNGWVYAATATTLYGVCVDNSGTSWSVPHEGFATAPVVTDDHVILNSKTGLVAYNAKDGTVIWMHNAADRAAAMLSVPYAVDKSLISYNLHEVSPISPIRAGDIVFYSANFGTNAASGRSILFGVNIADGRDSVPAALDGYKYHFSTTYAQNQDMLVKKLNQYYNWEVSSGIYQLYLKSSNNKYSQAATTIYLKSPAKTTNTGKFTNEQIEQTLTADGSITGTKPGKIYDYVYPYHAIIENSWITTASPAVSDGYLIAGYTSDTGGSLILHGAKTIPLYTGALSLRPSESTVDLSVPDATPLGILEHLKRDGKITSYTVDGATLTQINDIANEEGKTWSVTIGSSSAKLTQELEHNSLSQPVVFTYGSATEAEYRITVHALVKTELIAQQSVTIPSSLFVGSTDIAYTTPYGMLTVLSQENKLTFTTSDDKKSLTSLNTITNQGNNVWYAKEGDSSADLTLSVAANDQIVLYYGPKDQSSKAIYSYSLTVKGIVDWVTIKFASEYNRVLSPECESTATVIITDWHGNEISPVSAALTWSNTNSDAFSYVESSDKLSVTYKAIGAVGSRTTLSVQYAPTELNGDKLPSKISLSGTSDAITIINDQGAIPTNSAIETTQTYTTSHGNPARTGVAKGDGPQSNTILWDLDLFSKAKGYIPLVDGDPVVYNGKVYFTVWGSGGMTTSQGSYDGGKDAVVSVDGLYCVDALTGKIQWHNPACISRGGLAVHNGVVYGGTTEGMNGAQGWIFAVDADTGKEKWKTGPVSGYAYTGIASAPLVYKDKIYIVTRTASNEIVTSKLEIITDEGNTCNRNSIDITPVRGSAVAEKFATASVSPDGTIYVPGFSGIAAINSTTNSVLWVVDSGARGAKAQGGNNQFVGTPVYYDQHVYFASTGVLWCINPLTGKIVWKKENPAIQASTPVVTSNKIIVSGGTKKGPYSYGLSIYDHDGTLLKSTTEGQLNYASPIVAGNTAYFGTFSDQAVYAVDITTGNTVWKYKPAEVPNTNGGWLSLIEALPAVSGEVLYIGSENGHMYAFQTEDNTPFKIIAPPVITAGVEAVFTTNTSRNYYWSFDDKTSTSSTGTSVAKVWKEPGTHTVTAYVGNNKQTLTVTVVKAPEPYKPSQAKPTNLSAETGVTLPTDNSLTIKFGNDLSAESSADKITLNIDKYAAATKDSSSIAITDITITPPNTEKTIFRMSVSGVTGLKTGVQQNDLGLYVAIVIKLYIGETDINKVRFWRYTDRSAAPERLQLETTAQNLGEGWATYTVLTRGFSDIIATVEDANNDLVFVPATTPPSGGSTGGGTGGGGSGSASLNSLSYTNVNPGTGDFEYTTTDGTKYTVNGMTAFGVLNAAGLTLETKTWPGGIYVNAINGLAQDANLNGWMYQVNGYAPMVMSNSYPVSYGDKVVWYYSDNKMSTDPAKSKKYYAFTVSTAVSATGGGASGQTIGQTTKPGTIASTIVPAETKQIQVTIPDGIKVEKLDIGQKITIDTAVTKLTGTVSVNARNLIIIRPGIQITIPLADLIYNGDVATATIRGMTAEIVPVPVTIPKGGYNL